MTYRLELRLSVRIWKSFFLKVRIKTNSKKLHQILRHLKQMNMVIKRLITYLNLLIAFTEIQFVLIMTCTHRNFFCMLILFLTKPKKILSSLKKE